MMESGGVPFTMNVEPSGCNNNNGGWGDNGSWWIILFLIFAMFGWGGFGGYGNGSANGSGFQGYATRADINDGFAINNLQNGITAIQQAISDATYALNNALQSGFNGLQSQICNLGAQLVQCCCDIREAIQNVNYNMSMQTNMLQNTMNNNTRDQIENTNTGIRAVLDKLCQMEYNGLNDKYQQTLAENQALKFQASQTAQNAFITANQDAQTAELIRRLGRDCPVPAYVVPNPNCCYGNPVGIGYNNGCGGCAGCGGC